MKTAFFNTVPFADVADKGLSVNSPVPPAFFEQEVGERSLAEGFELFQLADEWGFDWISLAEHHYSPRQMTPNPLVLAGALSQCVRRARIAILGSLLPLNNPVRLAEEYAMLDQLTGGRLIVGLLRGTAPEYATYGTNPQESRSLYEEGIELLLKAWTEPQPFGWQGQHYQFRTVSVWPRPAQQPQPPVFLSGNSRESAALAAKLHLKMGVSFLPLPTAVDMVQYYRAEAAKAGWEPTADDVLFRGRIYVAETYAGAEADAEDYFPRGTAAHPTLSSSVHALIVGAGVEVPLGDRRQRFHEFTDFFGSPDTVTQQIRAFGEQAGIGTVDLLFQGGRLPHDMVKKTAALFAKEVLPRIREL